MRPGALNAIPPTELASNGHAQRRARHLRLCERLAELGMELAEAADRKALRDLQLPAPRSPSPLPALATIAACRPGRPAETPP